MDCQTRDELPPSFETLHVGIALYDPETGGILDANERLVELFGYGVEELRTLATDRYTANTYRFSEAEFRDRLRACVRGEDQEFTWRVKRADGTLIWVRIHLSRQHSCGRELVRAEVRDVTENYDTSHREELFWRLLRHNLRNETTVLLGYSQLLVEHARDQQLQAAAEEVTATARDLGDIADSVKEIQQAVAETDGERTRRNATAAIREVVDGVLAERPDASVSVVERGEMWIYVDSAFDHALSHAVENAIVHSESAEPAVEIRIGPSPNTGRVEITVSDTNQPIPPVELDALFDREHTSSTAHGTGVGLFVMKWCVESLGGEIAFERRNPRGNRVSIYLPPREPAAGSSS